MIRKGGDGMKSQRDLKLLEKELVEAIAGLDAQQTQLRPGGAASQNPATRWSVQQIVQHLLLSYEATTGAMQARLMKGTPTRATASLLQRAAQFRLLRMQRFPHGRSAPPAVTPKAQTNPVDGAVLQAEIVAALGRMGEHIGRAEKVFGADQKAVSHMVLGPMSLAQWRRFHLVHGRHHIQQIEGIKLGEGIV